jgi:putative membrane protein
MDENTKPDRSQQHLANQRTFLAWLRTCIVLIGLGFIIVKFDIFLQEIGLFVNSSSQDSAEHTSLLLGIGVIVFSITLLVYALKNYLVGHREITAGFHTPRNSIIYVSTIGIIVFSGMIIIYLILRVI